MPHSSAIFKGQHSSYLFMLDFGPNGLFSSESAIEAFVIRSLRFGPKVLSFSQLLTFGATLKIFHC